MTLSPNRRQAIFETNNDLSLNEHRWTNLSEIWISFFLTFSLKEMRLKMSSAKSRPSSLGLDVLRPQSTLPSAAPYGTLALEAGWTQFCVILLNFEGFKVICCECIVDIRFTEQSHQRLKWEPWLGVMVGLGIILREEIRCWGFSCLNKDISILVTHVLTMITAITEICSSFNIDKRAMNKQKEENAFSRISLPLPPTFCLEKK